MRLLEALRHIESEGYISFHMPGHKNGRLLKDYFEQTLKIDITEIPGADNLHAPMSCIAETEDSISKFYGVRKSKMLVSGSSIGILAMIMGTLSRGDEILVNRNVHQSVYHAMTLKGLKTHYIVPVLDEKLGIVSEISHSSVVQMLDKNPGIKACLLTYPTYEGICYPIMDIIRTLKQRNILVLIDEAHGAHLTLHSPNRSTVRLGADYVVQSFHKTLPAMTQTACLHFVTDDTSKDERILWHLKALQSSSPSYVLMASMDAMLSVIEEKGCALSKQLENKIGIFYESVRHLLTMQCHPIIHQEPTKIVIGIDPAFWDDLEWNGVVLSERLRNDFRIVVEYSTLQMCLLMTSIATTEEDLNALRDALIQIDEEIRKKRSNLKGNYPRLTWFGSIPERVCYPFEMELLEIETICSAASLGRISAEYITPYPPGIPLAVPGETIEQQAFQWVVNNSKNIKVLR